MTELNMTSHPKRPYGQKRRIPLTVLFILKSGTNKGQWLFTHRLFTTSEHLNPYLSLEWMWWLVLVSGVNKVPDYPTPVDVCTPCNYCLFTVLWVWAWCEWRTSMDRDRRSVLWYPNSSILRILFHCSIMQQQHPMLKTMCNALSVFFSFSSR